ncbi:unnamed protein product, partial [Adineta steineri]
MMNNGMSQPSVQHPYLNQGPSPSTQPGISTPPMMNSQYQGTQPPLHNHPPSDMNGASSYKQNQYPNGPPSVPHPYPNSGLPSSNNFGPPTTGTNSHLQGSQPPPHNPLS